MQLDTGRFSGERLEPISTLNCRRRVWSVQISASTLACRGGRETRSATTTSNRPSLEERGWPNDSDHLGHQSSMHGYARSTYGPSRQGLHLRCGRGQCGERVWLLGPTRNGPEPLRLQVEVGRHAQRRHVHRRRVGIPLPVGIPRSLESRPIAGGSPLSASQNACGRLAGVTSARPKAASYGCCSASGSARSSLITHS
jgi:hypothetical protein